MADDEPALEDKLACGEIAVFAREVMVQRQRQLGGVARRCVLQRVRQARRIAVERVAHPELLGLAVHYVREGRLAAPDAFGKHRRGVICRAGYDAQNQVLDPD